MNFYTWVYFVAWCASFEYILSAGVTHAPIELPQPENEPESNAESEPEPAAEAAHEPDTDPVMSEPSIGGKPQDIFIFPDVATSEVTIRASNVSEIFDLNLTRTITIVSNRPVCISFYRMTFYGISLNVYNTNVKKVRMYDIGGTSRRCARSPAYNSTVPISNYTFTCAGPPTTQKDPNDNYYMVCLLPGKQHDLTLSEIIIGAVVYKKPSYYQYSSVNVLHNEPIMDSMRTSRGTLRRLTQPADGDSIVHTLKERGGLMCVKLTRDIGANASISVRSNKSVTVYNSLHSEMYTTQFDNVTQWEECVLEKTDLQTEMRMFRVPSDCKGICIQTSDENTGFFSIHGHHAALYDKHKIQRDINWYEEGQTQLIMIVLSFVFCIGFSMLIIICIVKLCKPTRTVKEVLRAM